MRYAIRRAFVFPLSLVLVAASLCAAFAAENAGNVIAARKQAWAERSADQTVLAGKSPVFTGDTLNTNPIGRLQVLFLDDSVLMMAPDSRTTITEYVYGSGRQGAFNLSVAKGVTRLISGRITEADPNAMRVETTEVEVGIRGTDAIFEKTADATFITLAQASRGKALRIRDKTSGKTYYMDTVGTMYIFRRGTTAAPELQVLPAASLAGKIAAATLPLGATNVQSPRDRIAAAAQRSPIVVDTASGLSIAQAIITPSGGQQQDSPPSPPPPPPPQPPQPPQPPVPEISGTYSGTNLSGSYFGGNLSGSFDIGIADLSGKLTVNSVDIQLRNTTLLPSDPATFTITGNPASELNASNQFGFLANSHMSMTQTPAVLKGSVSTDDYVNVSGSADGTTMNVNVSGEVNLQNVTASGSGSK